MDHLRSHAEAFEAELNQAVSLGVRTIFSNHCQRTEVPLQAEGHCRQKVL